ncbi:MAG: (Fe-S)-binding protein [Candidatus Heimdallarchaeaceae archaeon]
MSSSPSWQVDVLEYAQKCIYCGYCSVCPTYKELKWENNHPRGIIEQIKLYYFEGTKEELKIEVSKQLFNSVFSCTMCHACEDICIVDIPLLKIWEQVRQEAFKKGRWSPALLSLYNKVKDTHNIFGLPPEERTSWAPMNNLNMSKRTLRKAPVAYFLGCQASYSGKMFDIPVSVVKVLRKSRVDFTILGEDEWCCGSPIFLAGGYSIGKSFAVHNLEMLKKLGVKKLVTACSGCYRTFKIVYPRILGEKWDIEVFHISEFVEELFKNGKLKVKNKIKEKITFKDPCELVRHCGLMEAPRNVINQIPDVRYEELPSNRKEALCCGGGGLLKINNDELVKKVNEHLIDEIEYSETDIVVNGCPTCLDTIRTGAKKRGLNVEVIDLSELVKRMVEDKK